jgi:serine/threonine protein kinase/tetratricopeptide (TPR) repeat protein
MSASPFDRAPRAAAVTEEVLFHAVLAQSPSDRIAYLAAHCHDAELRRRVEGLLASHDRPAGPLDAPANTSVFEAALPGTLIGPYKLLQQIGEGGMGTVYMAEQTHPVQRKVALKLIKPGMDSGQVIARFEAERQALAMMDHVNIARVLDAGATATGRPYFVMELVHGVPITKYCDDNHLTPRERLQLFVPVCQAIQHAHQKGIIHRDVKPSNVMVTLYDGKPVPKVIDFGVAKATEQKLTERTLFTQYGTMVGTLEYMSPEQAEMSALGVDTRSDIYSLGVLLYELLTGSTPLTRKRLKGAAYAEILRMIRDEEPAKPSTRLSDSGEALASISAQRKMEPARLTKLVRGELDWIVMKCLEKDRNRRYETASGFAADVQRYLADEPVQACPPSAWYRFRKFGRRNKGSLLAASVILFCLVAGIIGTSMALVWAVRERDDKATALVAETQARNAEKQARDKALAALRDMTDDIVENQMARGASLTDENREFLRKIIKYFEGFAADTADDVESRAIRAEGYFRVGAMRLRLGELKDAETALRAALALRKQLAADFPSRPEFRQDLALSQGNLGNLLAATGRLQEAETAFADALALRKQLVADFPAQSEFRRDLAVSHNNLGKLLSVTGRAQEALMAYAAAITLWNQMSADSPAQPAVRRNLAENYIGLSKLLYETGRPKEAETGFRDALALWKQMAADFPTRPEFRQNLALSQNNLAHLLANTGRPQEAETALRSALDIRKQLAADFPTRPQFRADLAMSHNTLGHLLSDTGRLKEAEADYAAALALRKQVAADFPTQPEFRQDLAQSHSNMGQLLRDTGRPQEAETALRAGLDIRKQLAAEFPTRPEFREDVARGHNTLGRLFYVTARLNEAETAFATALALYKQLATDFPTQTDFRLGLAEGQSNLGAVLTDMRRLPEAETAHRATLALRKQLANDFPARIDIRVGLPASYGNLATVLEDTGRLQEAETAYVAAISLDKQLAADFPNQPDLRDQLAGAFGNLGFFHLRQRDFNAAKAQLEGAVPHHNAALKTNPRNPTYRQSYRNTLTAFVQTYAGLDEQPAAKQAAEKLRDLGWDPPADAYDAACGLSTCIPIVQKNQKAKPEERDKQALFYGDEAMTMLRDAVAKGFHDVAHMKEDKDLDGLRGREDFKKLFADQEARKNGSKIKDQKLEKKP